MKHLGKQMLARFARRSMAAAIVVTLALVAEVLVTVPAQAVEQSKSDYSALPAINSDPAISATPELTFNPDTAGLVSQSEFHDEYRDEEK